MQTDVVAVAVTAPSDAVAVVMPPFPAAQAALDVLALDAVASPLTPSNVTVMYSVT